MEDLEWNKFDDDVSKYFKECEESINDMRAKELVMEELGEDYYESFE